MKFEAPASPLNILVLEDRASDAELMMAQLVEAGFAVVWRRVETEKEYLQSLRAGLDLIIADYQLPQFDAIHALKLLCASELDIPFIIVSGEVGDDFIVEAMKQGAADFLLKDRMARLATAVKQALERKYMRMTQMEGNRKLGQAMAESEGIRADLETANRALGVKNQQLSELYRTAQRFMDDVSHEFRTPLSVIKGYSEIIYAGIAGVPSPDQKKFCRIIIDRTRDMAQMIDDLLDSSKLRAGSLRVDRRPCDLATILSALHPIIDSRLAASKIQWSQELAPGLPQIFGDAEKVIRVLVNLVVNAIKFSPEGSRLLLSVMLRRVWFNCSVRRSGAQGIQAFIHDPVDLVITDLRMEAGDGIALIESIRRTSRVPVIIVTGFAAQYADRVRFLDNVALLNKPFEWAALVDLVEKALDSRSPHGTWNIPPGTFEPVG
jgi:signal transduction histidine kinase